MQHRPFRALDRSVSEIGVGTWQLGSEWAHVEDGEALAILDAAHAAGIDFFDTADIYGAGRSESLVGAFLRRATPRPVVATKLGRRADPGWPQNFTLPVMRAHVEDSLRRLGVDALDLLQLHCVPPAELVRGEVFAHLRQLQDEGKIRAFGASVESVAEARTCLLQEGLASLQVIFNVLRQTPAEALLAEAERRGVAVIVRLPLASGLLADKFTVDTVFGPDDHRAFNRGGKVFHAGETFAGLPYEQGLALVAELRGHVPAGWSMADFAQRWILDHAAVTTVITGCSRREHAPANASASSLPPLSARVHDELRAWWRERVRPAIAGND
ncbi:MAG: aldo/keto reductase [Planctomycetota bacterium]